MSSIIKILTAAFILFPGLMTDLSAQTITGTVRIHGIIRDKSTGLQVKASNIRLLAFENPENPEAVSKGDGMQVLAGVQAEQDRFDFASVPARQSGYLLSVNYDKENYIMTIPLKDALSGKPAEMPVYSMGADPSSVQVTSMQLIKKMEHSLIVERAYVVSNQSSPPRSYSAENLKFLLPQGAMNLRATMQLEADGMTVPVGVLEDKDGTGFSIDRSFQKGTTTMTVYFEYPSHQMPDRMPDVISRDGSSPKCHNFRILSWKPDDAKPVIDGGESEPMEIPKLGTLLKVSYPTDKELILDFRKGSVFFDKGTASAENPVYSSALRSSAGLFSFIAFLFLLLHFYNYSRNR